METLEHFPIMAKGTWWTLVEIPSLMPWPQAIVAIESFNVGFSISLLVLSGYSFWVYQKQTSLIFTWRRPVQAVGAGRIGLWNQTGVFTEKNVPVVTGKRAIRPDPPNISLQLLPRIWRFPLLTSKVGHRELDNATKICNDLRFLAFVVEAKLHACCLHCRRCKLTACGFCSDQIVTFFAHIPDFWVN